MEIPVRQLNCCSGDLADLKVKSCDIEAWSPRDVYKRQAQVSATALTSMTSQMRAGTIRKCDMASIYTCLLYTSRCV